MLSETKLCHMMKSQMYSAMHYTHETPKDICCKSKQFFTLSCFITYEQIQHWFNPDISRYCL